jgi:hypothetical protein
LKNFKNIQPLHSNILYFNSISFKSDLNVILVDWKDGAAAPDYPKARDNVRVAGKKVNDFFRATRIDPKTIYCVGHSLGV